MLAHIGILNPRLMKSAVPAQRRTLPSVESTSFHQSGQDLVLLMGSDLLFNNNGVWGAKNTCPGSGVISLMLSGLTICKASEGFCVVNDVSFHVRGYNFVNVLS